MNQGTQWALLTLVHIAYLAQGVPSFAQSAVEIDLQPRGSVGCSLGLQDAANRAPTGPDSSTWQSWWRFNHAPYLALKSRVAHYESTSGFVCGSGGAEFYHCTQAILEERIVPSLLHALRSSPSTDVASACLGALARIEYAPDARNRMAAEILRWLSSDVPLIQESATVALGVLGEEASVPVLVSLLEDDSRALLARGIRLHGQITTRVRALAGFALGLIGRQATQAGRQVIVQALIRGFDAVPNETAERDIPVACITSIGLTALPMEESGLGISDRTARSERADPISNRLEQLQWLFTKFEDPTRPMLDRAQIPTACARLLNEDLGTEILRQQVALRLLVPLRASAAPDWRLRQSCVLALGRLGDCDGDDVDVEIRRSLAAQVRQDTDAQCKCFALIALARVCGRPGPGAGGALQGLQARDDPRALLARQFREARTPTRPWAALAMAILERSLEDAGQPTSRESVATIRRALADSKAPAEIGPLALAAGICKDPEATIVLRSKFEVTAEPEARGLVAIGLGLVGDRSSIALISDVLRKSRFQPDVRRSAVIGLALLGEGEVVPELVSMLGSAVGISSPAFICSALGSIGDVRAVLPLIEVLGDEQEPDLVRAFAADALGRIGDRNVLPWTSILSIDLNYRASTPTLWSPDECRGILDLF
jgi:HEAT repeat protein